jgi:beta-lactam-binding protein with PASTA domain
MKHLHSSTLGKSLSTIEPFGSSRRAARQVADAGDAGWFSTRRVRTCWFVTILVWVMITSACTKKVTVPSVVQMDLDQAKSLLGAVRLKTGMVSSAEGTVIPGAYVISQTPPAGQQVAADSAINLTVELPVSVPNLVDSNLTDAVNTLQTIGLKVMLMKQPTMNIFGKAKVVQQNPPASSIVRHDAAVMLTVTAPPDLGAMLGAVSKDPAYQKLNPEYRSILNTFLK